MKQCRIIPGIVDSFAMMHDSIVLNYDAFIIDEHVFIRMSPNIPNIVVYTKYTTIYTVLGEIIEYEYLTEEEYTGEKYKKYTGNNFRDWESHRTTPSRGGLKDCPYKGLITRDA